MGLLVIFAVIAVPLYSRWLLKQQNEDMLPYWMVLVTIFVVWLIPFLLDLKYGAADFMLCLRHLWPFLITLVKE